MNDDIIEKLKSGTFGVNPNREQRRKNERDQRLSEKKHIKYALNSKKNRAKLNKIIEAMKKQSLDLKSSIGVTKLFFCINFNNISDILVVPCEGSEDMKKSLGVRTDITLDNGVIRKDNIVVYTEVNDDGTVLVNDGSGVYLDRN